MNRRNFLAIGPLIASSFFLKTKDGKIEKIETQKHTSIWMNVQVHINNRLYEIDVCTMIAHFGPGFDRKIVEEGQPYSMQHTILQMKDWIDIEEGVYPFRLLSDFVEIVGVARTSKTILWGFMEHTILEGENFLILSAH